MKMQGKVKSISLNELNVTKGLQVIWKPFDNLIIVTIVKVTDEMVWFKEGGCHISQLKTLVIEYDYYSYHATVDNERPEVKIPPLKFSQWQSVIDRGEVDSDRTVVFELVQTLVHPKCKLTKVCQETEGFKGTEHEGLDMCEDGCVHAGKIASIVEENKVYKFTKDELVEMLNQFSYAVCEEAYHVTNEEICSSIDAGNWFEKNIKKSENNS